MENTEFNYIDEAHRTASGEFHGDLVHLRTFARTLNLIIGATETLDGAKKALFYGKLNLNVHPESYQYTSKPENNCENLIELISPNANEDENYKNIIHGIVGVVTEAGELLEALSKSIELKEPLDIVNIREEIGDIFWYLALICKAVKTDFEAEQLRNIRKLKARFPDKFTEENANNRDLFTERKILEK